MDAQGSNNTKQKKTSEEFLNNKHKDLFTERMRLRNEGVAFYESGIALKKAQRRFQEALKLAPQSVVENYNYGVVLRKRNQGDEAIKYFNAALDYQSSFAHAYYSIGLIKKKKGDIDGAFKAFSQGLKVAPDEASLHYQLSRIEREKNHTDKALQYIVSTLHLDPYHTGALYQLYLYHQQNGDKEKAEELFKEFSRLKRALGKTRLDINADESHLAQPMDSNSEMVLSGNKPADVIVKMVEKDIVPEKNISAYKVFDVDHDDLDDLVIADKNGRVFWVKNKGKLGFEHQPAVELPNATVVNHLDVGTLEVNGSVDVVLATQRGIYVLEDFFLPAETTEKSNKHGASKPPSKNSIVDKSNIEKRGRPVVKRLSNQSTASVRLYDVDHDGDLDILADLFSQVMINDGQAHFTLKSDYLPVATQTELSHYAEAAISDLRNLTTVDWVVYQPGGQRRWLKDLMGGHYELQVLTRAQAIAPIIWSLAADMDNDGWADLVYMTQSGLYLDRNLRGKEFQTIQLQGRVTGSSGLASTQVRQDDNKWLSAKGAIVDINGDGFKDVFFTGTGSSQIAINRGGMRFQLLALDIEPVTVKTHSRVAVSDIDNDGKLDLLALTAAGELKLLKNATAHPDNWLKISLTGNRSAPDGQFAQVEVRYGTFYSSYESAGGTLHIPLGKNPYAEILRITWPNGFVENKFRVEGNHHWHFTESERISGSCPSIYTWADEQYHYITDAFVSGPIGVPFGKDGYFSVDDDEYIKLSSEHLQVFDGQYRVSIVEELREVNYFDQIKLFAVDHPATTEIHPNEYLKYMDSPRFGLHATNATNKVADALSAVFDKFGNDISDVVARVDASYVSDVEPIEYTGFSEPHYVELELTQQAMQSDSLRLFLTGWFYYFDSTALFAAAQNPDLKIQWPQVQAWVDNQWQSVTDFGLPAGKGKTVVVDLSGLVPAGANRLRILSSLQIYWDRILVDIEAPPADTYRLQELPLQHARLRLHGFSELERDETAAQKPDRFNYHRVSFDSFWDPLPGLYTRFGSVETLLQQIDSQMVVFGSADELALRFDATALAPPAENVKRDFILYINGYVKDGDKYTAHSDSTEPMPFAGMKQFPFSVHDVPQELVNDPGYQEYLNTYQTRNPLTFTRPQGQ